VFSLSQSLTDMRREFEMLDREIALTPMPAEYATTMRQVRAIVSAGAPPVATIDGDASVIARPCPLAVPTIDANPLACLWSPLCQ
jgi:hypothetical protein